MHSHLKLYNLRHTAVHSLHTIFARSSLSVRALPLHRTAPGARRRRSRAEVGTSPYVLATYAKQSSVRIWAMCSYLHARPGGVAGVSAPHAVLHMLVFTTESRKNAYAPVLTSSLGRAAGGAAPRPRTAPPPLPRPPRPRTAPAAAAPARVCVFGLPAPGNPLKTTSHP